MSQAGRYQLGTGANPPIEFVQGNDGINVGPNGAGIIFLPGAHGINTTNTAANTETIAINNAITLGDLVVLGPGVNALTITTGDIGITAGNLKLPITNAAGSQGEIRFGGFRWISNYGTNNTFVGRNSGNTSLTVGSAISSTGIGAVALSALTTGAECTALGSQCLQSNTTGNFNTGVGSRCMPAVISSSANTSVGHISLDLLTTGIGQNTAVGYASGNFLLTGSDNCFYGYGSGSNYTGAESNNITIGPNVNGTLGESGVIRLGQTAGPTPQTTCFIGGISGVNVGSVARVVTNAAATDQLGTAVITAGTNITVVPGANLITINATTPAAVATSYATDSGSAIPAANILTIAGGLNIDTSGAGSTVTIAASPDQYLANYRVANATPFVVNATDFYITVDTSAIAITIQLPNAPTIYRRFIIKDSAGNAAANNITVTTVAGLINIDAATTFVMNTNWMAIQLVYDGFGYQVF